MLICEDRVLNLRIFEKFYRIMKTLYFLKEINENGQKVQQYIFSIALSV